MQKSNPFISIIVTTYNRPQLLKETIDSILSQTYTNFELIVVDNYSNYDFYKFMDKFGDNRIKAYQNENKGIIAVNRNFGIKKAAGDYIAFCDDDDIWMENKLEKQLKHLMNNDIVGVGSTTILIGENYFQRDQRLKENVDFDFKKILAGNNVALSSLIVRNLGFLFDEKEEFKFVEDFDFQINLTLKTNKYIRLLKDPVVKYRIFFGKDLNKGERSFQVIDKYKSYLNKEENRDILQNKNHALGLRALKQGNSKSTRLLIKSYKYSSSYIGRSKIIMLILLSLLPYVIFKSIMKFYYSINANNTKYK